MKYEQSNVSGLFFHWDNGGYTFAEGIYWISPPLCLIEESKTELEFFWKPIIVCWEWNPLVNHIFTETINLVLGHQILLSDWCPLSNYGELVPQILEYEHLGYRYYQMFCSVSSMFKVFFCTLYLTPSYHFDAERIWLLIFLLLQAEKLIRLHTLRHTWKLTNYSEIIPIPLRIQSLLRLV